MIRTTLRSLAAALVTLLALANFASAQVPQFLQYQGRLTDASGNPLPGSSAKLQFDIYDAASGGNLLFTQLIPAQALSSGQFTALLNLSSFNGKLAQQLAIPGSNLWVQITANDVVLPTRQQITSVLTAYKAQVADTAKVALSTTTLVTIDGSQITGTIDGAKLANSSVAGAKLGLGAAIANIANGSIAGTQLANGAVGPQQLAAGAAAANIANGSITGAQLANGAVGPQQLALGAAVGNIANGTIASAQLAPGAAAGNLADGTVPGTRLTGAGSVAASLLGAGIDGAKLAAGSVTSTQIASGTIQHQNMLDMPGLVVGVNSPLSGQIFSVSSAWTILDSLTIIVPADGLVEADFTISSGGINTRTDYFTITDNATVPQSPPSPTATAFGAGTNAVIADFVVDCKRVFKYPTPTARQIIVWGYASTGEAAYNGWLTAHYYPRDPRLTHQ